MPVRVGYSRGPFGQFTLKQPSKGGDSPDSQHSSEDRILDSGAGKWMLKGAARGLTPPCPRARIGATARRCGNALSFGAQSKGLGAIEYGVRGTRGDLQPHGEGMSVPGTLTRTFREALERCGFERALVRPDYEYADFRAEGMPLRKVALAAFGSRPLDFQSACVALVEAPVGSGDRASILKDCWALGALYVFVLTDRSTDWWVMKGRSAPEHQGSFPLSGLDAFFAEHGPQFAPARILEDKRPFSRQLDFVDAGLLPALCYEVGEKLHGVIERLVRESIRAYGSSHGRAPDFPKLYRLIFRLLAGKILQDKGARIDVDFASPTNVLTRVASYYGGAAFSRPALEDPEVQLLVSQRVAEAIRFHNLSPESLAYIYENTLVTPETRKRYGTHSTPRFIADYVTWRLPIDEIPVDERHVFDPGVGCATFLVSAMRRLRMDVDPAWSDAKEHQYFATHLCGFDDDDFALETAFLSLTLADFPDHDGWDLSKADLWTTRALEDGCAKARILLANPPFQDFDRNERGALRAKGKEPVAANKATELMRRAIPHLPAGALMGVVLPRETLEGEKSQTLREHLLRDFELIEICLLPDRMFTHSGAESGLLLARKGAGKTPVFFRQIGEEGRNHFREYYQATTEDRVPQAYFSSRPGKVLRVPRLREVWDYLASRCKSLSEVAEPGQGLSYLGREHLPPDAKTISRDYFFGAVRGYADARDSLSCFSLHSPVWMSPDESVIQRARSGAAVGTPRVLFNYARTSRGAWRAQGAVDRNGLAITSSFYAVSPKDRGTPLEAIAAIINGPVTNAYLYCTRGERNNSYPLVRGIPVPPLGAELASQIERAELLYEDALSVTPRPADEELRLLLARIDALVLELYQLPKRLREQLLSEFAGLERPGAPPGYVLTEALLSEAMELRPTERESVNPWASLVGMWADDSTWKDFNAEVERIRHGGGEAE